MGTNRGWKLTVLSGLILLALALQPLFSPANAAQCVNSPTKFGITFEKTTTAAKFPGRFYIAFRNPLPEDYTISGGTTLYWKTDGMFTYFRVSGVAPWSYRLHWQGDCASAGSGSW